MNPRPPEGTQPDTLHWLYRSTGKPNWMVATWTGDAWNILTGRFVRPEDAELVFWKYSAPAVPPSMERAP